MTLTVPCAADTTVTATAALTHQCPYRNEVDKGIATVTWRTNGATVELHALVALLGDQHDRAVSHEDLTAELAEHLDALPGIAEVVVTTTWTTAGAEVVVSSAVPREPQHRFGA